MYQLSYSEPGKPIKQWFGDFANVEQKLIRLVAIEGFDPDLFEIKKVTDLFDSAYSKE